jgi:Ca2+-binding RTX toxin-like protein
MQEKWSRRRSNVSRPVTETLEVFVYSIGSVTRNKALTLSLFTALLASGVVALFVFGAKQAGAAADTITIDPVKVVVGDVAVGETDTTTVTITNDSGVEAEVGEIDIELLNGSADLDIVKLVDTLTGEEFVLDPITGLVTSLLGGDPLTIVDGGERVLEIVLEPTEEGPINLKLLIDLLNSTTDTLIKEVPVIVEGEGHTCTISGTDETNDELVDPSPDDDVVCGLGGNDTIRPNPNPNLGGGDDVFIGGPGNDTLNVKDGRRNDVASGGSGKDTCQKDKKDKKVNCGKRGKAG